VRSWQIITVLLLCLALAGSLACSPFGGGGEEKETGPQLIEVVRGDLVVSVSGSGNIGVSNEAKLAFGVGGRIDKIYVKEGDEVNEDDVLARLDTGALELALTKEQIALQTAEYNLAQARDLYTWPRIKTAQSDIDDAEAYVDYVLERGLSEATLVYAQARLTAAEATLDAMINSYDTEEVAIKRLELELAQQSLEYAQKQLDEATLTVLFDGVVASVYVDEGDTILSTTTIIHLLDPTSMELEVEVDEIDIPVVKLGQRVIIEVDALPDVELEGEVTFISPLAREESGLVLYEVKISLAVPEGSGLRAGMSAAADIVIDERSNVLLVPDRAIKQDGQGNPVVEVMVGEQTQERPVVVGISDGFQTEIVDGLKKGEIVVIEARVKSRSSGPGLF